jgi:hypothetical protein
VQDTPTATYSWVADQFGHFALGFEITFALSWVFVLQGWDQLPTILWVPALILIGFSLKELSDYMTARSKATQSKSDFPFDNGEILWNMGTAVLYIGLGVAIAGPAVVLSRRWDSQPALALVPLLLLIPVAVVAGLVGVWWLRRKITFQQAGLPMMYRLAIFPNYLGEGAELKANIAYIDALIDPRQPSGRHLVIAGPPLAGKSSLATGVGTEFAFKEGIGRYTTLIKLLEAEPVRNPESDSPSEFQDGRILWPLQSADILIVDDVDYLSGFQARVKRRMATEAVGAGAGHRSESARRVTEHEELAGDPTEAIHEVELALRDRLPASFRAELAKRRSVWVVGDGSEAIALAWATMVRQVLGLTGEPDAVKLVQLKMTVAEAIRRKGGAADALRNPPWILRDME